MFQVQADLIERPGVLTEAMIGPLRLLQLLLEVAREFDLQPAWQRGLPGHEILCPASHAVFTTLHERAFDLDLGFQQMFPLIPRGVPDRMKDGGIKPEFELASNVATQGCLVCGPQKRRACCGTAVPESAERWCTRVDQRTLMR